MDLVLLPHHNTVSSLQKLQHSVQGAFIPAYPAVCLLAHTDRQAEDDTDLLKKHMQVLRETAGKASGFVTFRGLEITDNGGKLILPAEVPFMDCIRQAGFIPDQDPHFILGYWPDRNGSLPASEDIPPARMFRLALMDRQSLSEDTETSFSWKFSLPFWIKLH